MKIKELLVPISVLHCLVRVQTIWLSQPNAKTLHTVKTIRKIYGRITRNQLPVPVPLFLREPVKNISHGRTG